MKIDKLIFGTLAATAFMFLLDWLWYGMIMKDAMTMPGMKEKPDMMYLVVSYIIFAVAFVHIYGKGAEGGSKVSQGMKFGIWATILVSLSLGLMWYALTTTMTLNQVFMDTGYSLVKYILMGILVAYVTGIPGNDSTREGGKGGTG